jgi:SAM-dependent methyltransferase
MYVRRTIRGVRQMIVNHGWTATAQSVRDRLKREMKARLRPAMFAPMNSLTWQPTAEHAFDREYGVDTSGLIWGDELKTGSRNDAWNTAYYGIGPSVFHRVMAQVPEDLLRTACFIDLGCGKGRALLLATHYWFVQIIGVEIAPQLHGIAVENVARFSAVGAAERGRSEPRLKVLLEDAARYRFPSGPLVIYLYHPFCRPVLEQVLRNLGQSLEDEPRDIAVIYINHELSNALDRTPYLERAWGATVEMDASDRLADRVGSSAEDCAIYLARRRD